MQFFTYRGQESVASRSGQPLWVDHQSGNGRLVSPRHRDASRRQSFIAFYTLLFEPQFQQCGDLRNSDRRTVFEIIVIRLFDLSRKRNRFFEACES